MCNVRLTDKDVLRPLLTLIIAWISNYMTSKVWCQITYPTFQHTEHRKTTCLLSIRKSFACARASKLMTTTFENGQVISSYTL